MTSADELPPGHLISTQQARDLCATVGARYSDDFRRELEIVIEWTAKRLAAGDKPSDDWRDLNRLIISGPECWLRIAAVAAAFTQYAVEIDEIIEGARFYEKEDGFEHVAAHRERGRPEQTIVNDFLGALIDLAARSGGSVSLFTHGKPDGRSPLIEFVKQCSDLVQKIVVANDEARKLRTATHHTTPRTLNNRLSRLRKQVTGR